jgi:uncharacterized membrane protein YvbJ
MNCQKCNNQISEDVKFCSKCGSKITIQEPIIVDKTDIKQKSFKLDMSKDANRRGLMGIGFLILLRLLGPVFGSYLIAGIVLGVIFAVIEFIINKNRS